MKKWLLLSSRIWSLCSKVSSLLSCNTLSLSRLCIWWQPSTKAEAEALIWTEILGEITEGWAEWVPVTPFTRFFACSWAEWWIITTKYFVRLSTEPFPKLPLYVRLQLPTDAKPWVGFSGREKEVKWKKCLLVGPLAFPECCWQMAAKVTWVFITGGDKSLLCLPKMMLHLWTSSWTKLFLSSARLCIGDWRNSAWLMTLDSKEIQLSWKSRQVR